MDKGCFFWVGLLSFGNGSAIKEIYCLGPHIVHKTPKISKVPPYIFIEDK